MQPPVESAPYLTNDAVERLLDAASGLSSPGSRLALDHAGGADDEVLRRARSLASMGEITSMWPGGLFEGASMWLSRHGWDTRTVYEETLGERHGRRVNANAHRLHSVLVTARRVHPDGGALVARRSHSAGARLVPTRLALRWRPGATIGVCS